MASAVRPRALIVEDDAAVRASMAMLLGAMGVDCHLAADGKAAMEEFDRSAFDVAMIDLGLPDIDGEILSDRLLQIDPLLAIVIMSSADAVQNRSAILSRYRVDKPAKPGQLREILNGILPPTSYLDQ